MVSVTHSTLAYDAKHSRYPVGIDLFQALASIDTFLRLQGSDQDAVRAEEVRNGRSLRQKFRVGKDVESAVRLGVGFQDGAHRLGGAAWHSGLLNDDLGGSRDLCDASRGQFHISL